MKRYIYSSKEFIFGPYSYRSKYQVEKAAETSSNIDELEAIAHGKINGTIQYKLAANPNTPEDILIDIARTTQNLHALNTLVLNPRSNDKILDILTSRYMSGDAVEFGGNPIYNLCVNRLDYSLSPKFVRYIVARNPGNLRYLHNRLNEIHDYLDDEFMLDIINDHQDPHSYALEAMAEIWDSPAVLDALKSHPNPDVRSSVYKNPHY